MVRVLPGILAGFEGGLQVRKSFLMRVKWFYEYFCRNMQENEELLQKTIGEIEFRISKNKWNFGGSFREHTLIFRGGNI